MKRGNALGVDMAGEMGGREGDCGGYGLARKRETRYS
jgi:hypothetical protein